MANAGLGDKAGALALAERAMAVNPIEKDAVSGPYPMEVLARVRRRWENPTAPLPLYRNCSRCRAAARWPKVCR